MSKVQIINSSDDGSTVTVVNAAGEDVTFGPGQSHEFDGIVEVHLFDTAEEPSPALDPSVETGAGSTDPAQTAEPTETE